MEMNGVPERSIKSGIYLVVDPSMEESALLKKTEVCLRETLVAVQIWDNFYPGQDIAGLVQKISDSCHKKNVPVLINNRWELLLNSALDGVHFDQIPEDYAHILARVNRTFLIGLTCTNDLSQVRWARDHQLDYISFCSMFPSTTSTSCELVEFSTIHAAAEIFNLPIFLAGGIRPENLEKLKELKYSGIAVVSGIMSSNQPDESIKQYYKELTINRL